MGVSVGTDVQIFVLLSLLFLTGLTLWGASCHERVPVAATAVGSGTTRTWVWDSISEMITRSDKLRNMFVLYVFLSVIGFGTCLALLMERAKLLREGRGSAMDRATHVGTWVAFVVAGLAQLGFAVMSMDVDSEQHNYLASIAFGSLLVASVLLCLHLDETLYYGKLLPLFVSLSAGACAVAFALGASPFFEYALVALLHAVFGLTARVRNKKRFVLCRAMILSPSYARPAMRL